MPNIYDEIFKCTDIFNPVSLQTLTAAGKLANLEPEKALLDLGCGKGIPSLFLASVFGVKVEGYDLSQISVDYANARAKLLNLSDRVAYFQQDLQGFVPAKKYDFVASLGVEPELYGGREAAFKLFRSVLNEGGAVLYTEPVWTKRPVNPQVLKAFGFREEIFLTIPEMQQLLNKVCFQEVAHFVSSKDDWDLYGRPPKMALQQMLTEKKWPDSQLQMLLDSFQMEYEAAGRDWNVVLWVLKPA
jgi:cyclopropane fatty-acyl-phospholipid synthase-like methyltransferase